MKNSTLNALLLTAGVLLSPSAANADDHKIFSTYQCAANGATTAADLLFDLWGVTNPTDEPQQVLCPLQRDAEAAYAAGNTLTVTATYRAGLKAGSVYCTTYETTRVFGNPSTSASATASYNAPWIARWTAGEATMEIATSAASGQIGLLCTLTPKVTLGPIRVYESGETDHTP